MSEDTSLDRATDFLSDDGADAGKTRQAEIEALGERITDAIRTVYDPEIPVNIFELGLIYKIDVDDNNHVDIEMTLTSPGCPVAGILPEEVRSKVETVEGVSSAAVEVVWDPPWNPGMMSEDAQLELGIMY